MVELKTVETVDTSPFKKLVVTIGELPTSFVESMTYYELLAWFTNYLQNTIIPAVNNNGECVTELQNKFVDLTNATKAEIEEFETNITALYNQLKNYVDTYFDTLDVQTEVNNKLDAMVLDGTLSNIINQEIFGELNDSITSLQGSVNNINTTIGDLANLETVKKDSIVNAINSANLNDIEYYRKKYSNNYELFTNKGNVSYFNNVTIFKDKYNGSFKYYIDLDSFKNTGGSNIYVKPSTTESPSSQTGALDHPFNSIKKAYDIASDGDTIYLFDDIYYRNNIGFGTSTYFDKSVNILPYQTGKVYLFNGDKLTFTQNGTYSNVYQTTRSNVVCGYDIRHRDDGIFPLLTKVTSLDECSTTMNSYYTSDSIVYVNIGEVATSDKVIFGLSLSFSPIRIRPTSANVKVYMEGITSCGGDLGIFDIAGSDAYDCEVIAKDCNFLYSFDDDANALRVQGANTIFQNCKACFGMRDGFNYHKLNDKRCNSIELDCIGANNGINSAQNNNNGSTTHDGNKCLRINGVYFNNKGGNVTDVQTDTHSININCAAFDSKSSGTTSKGDFIAQQAGVTMDLYNCYSKGSSSYVNIYGVADTTLNVHNCIADNVYSEGTINID